MPNDQTDVATLAARLDAVERALTDETRTAARPAAEPGAASTAPEAPPERDDTTDDAVRRLERRVEELTAELDAVRGLLGGVEAVNESVERRANLALAAVERTGSEQEADGLVVERLPDGEGAFEDPESTSASASASPPPSPTAEDDEDSADSLAARLREAL